MNQKTKQAIAYFTMLLGAVFTPQVLSEPLQAEAQAAVKMFGSKLKQTLLSAIEQDGLSSAVAVCSEQAPAIAQDIAVSGWQVGRTSLRVRNPANQPDDWEKAQLLWFAERLKQGARPNELFVQARDAETSTYRYMAPIMTGGLCLNCHGANLTEDVQATIDALYPQDQATGFSLGELRGAFSVSKQQVSSQGVSQ